jgi:hypothetical protein
MVSMALKFRKRCDEGEAKKTGGNSVTAERFQSSFNAAPYWPFYY